MLWVELFDSPADANCPGPAIERRLMDSARDAAALETKASSSREMDQDLRDGLPYVIRRFKDGLLAHLNRLDEKRTPGAGPGRPPVLDKEHLGSSPFLLYIGKVGMEIKKELHEQGKPSGAAEIAAECKQRWQSMPKEEQKVGILLLSPRTSGH
jgi:palmitoyltransferase